MSNRLFGTDGVRGKAGDYPLDHETVARLGGALVRAMGAAARSAPAGRPLRFLVGRDTRESGEWIERELARGIHSAGAEITTAGVIPTPAVAYVTRAMGFDAGLVISASHNPFEDNGIKVFSGKGEKFSESLEREVEADHSRQELDRLGARRSAGRSHGRDRRLHRARGAGAAGPAAARGVQAGDRRGQRRHHDRRAPAVPGARLRRRGPERVARRAQHQPRLRLDPPGAARPGGARARLPHGCRVRRRRRPRDLRRRIRAGSWMATPCS